MVKGFATKLISLIFMVAGIVAAQSAPSAPAQTAPRPGQSAKPPFDTNAPVQLMPGTSRKDMPAQSAPSRKGIPEIAKGANGAIVTIVMANDDKPIALGTGFLVRPDGVIVTNYHVIATGNVAVVKFVDGTVSPVDGVLAADKVRDLAIVKIHGRTFRTLTLGNSDQIQVGEEVVAIGNPLGLELSVSNGILSGVRRDEKEGGKLLQVTAPISHGSSGGPLFNMFGEVIGINAMFLEGGENLNFAIPVNDAKDLLSNKSTTLHSLPNEQPSENGTSAEGNENSNDLREQIGWLQAKTGHRELKSDELRETLRWMQDTLPEGSSECLRFSGNSTCFKAELPKISGCTVNLRIRGLSGTQLEIAGYYIYYLDLGNVDSERIFSKSEHDDNHEYKEFYLYTWNDTKKILHIEVPANDFKNELSFPLTTDYGVRFEKAFRHAVDLCGGMPSTVKF
jgi:S1-C subfamily serine protease